MQSRVELLEHPRCGLTCTDFSRGGPVHWRFRVGSSLELFWVDSALFTWQCPNRAQQI